MFIIISGNPVDGFAYTGPFTSFESASEFTEKDAHLNDDDWWITELDSPESLPSGEQVKLGA